MDDFYPTPSVPRRSGITFFCNKNKIKASVSFKIVRIWGVVVTSSPLNKIGMALGTSLLAIVLSTAGYVSNVAQNQDVLSAMHHAFSTIPGVLWVITAGVLLFYRLDKKKYNRIVNILKFRERNNNVQS